MDDELLTVAEVAERLRLSQQTVRNWIDRCELPAVRVGQRRVRVRQSDLDEFVAPAKTTSAAGSNSQHATMGGGAELTDIDARGRLAAALAELVRVATVHDSHEVVVALRALSSASEALADVVERESRASS